jgi:ATP-binding cassette subfamily B multidrug efflux pump
MKHLAYINSYFWKYRGHLFAGFILIALGDVFGVYAPVIVRDGIDILAASISVVQDKQEAVIEKPDLLLGWDVLMGKSGDHMLHIVPSNAVAMATYIAIFLAIAYLVLYVVKGVFLFYQRQALIVMSRHVEYDLKNEVYAKYQELDLSFYRKNRTGDLMNRISEDVSRVRMYVGPAIMYILNLIVMLVMCVTVMFAIDPELTLYTLSPLPFMMIAIYFVSKKINAQTEHVQAQQSKLSAMVQEFISGIRVLKTFSRTNHFTDTFSKESASYKAEQLRLVKIDALFMPVVVMLVGLGTLLTIYIGSLKVIAGEISPGVIVQFVFYVNILTWPFAVVGWVTSLVMKAEASMGRINEFLQTKTKIEDAPEPQPFVRGDIQFNGVGLVYEETGIHALHRIDLTIPAGSRLGIIGSTGSGKSTLANLLSRMIDPTEGSITIHGTPLPLLSLSDLRSKIGVVPQEVFLFSDTIANNIAFGRDAMTQEEIERVTKQAGVHDNIMGFENRYETLLGERGINLSGGQKQRVSIARAIARNPEILIFDDCLSAVDTETEDRILTELKEVMKNRTTIFISHRISTIQDCDHIILMDKGQIIESGSHESLVALNGRYASLLKKQQFEREHRNE